MSKQKGCAAEDFAKSFLMKQGLQWIMSNYHCRFGEIDLIMKDQRELVFVEVRQRRSMLFGGAAASVTWQKQKKLLLTAQHFRLVHEQWSRAPCRIDVVALQGVPPSVDWIKNAVESRG